MKCKACGSEMVQLFTSVSCPRCDSGADPYDLVWVSNFDANEKHIINGLVGSVYEIPESVVVVGPSRNDGAAHGVMRSDLQKPSIFPALLGAYVPYVMWIDWCAKRNGTTRQVAIDFLRNMNDPLMQILLDDELFPGYDDCVEDDEHHVGCGCGCWQS